MRVESGNHNGINVRESHLPRRDRINVDPPVSTIDHPMIPPNKGVPVHGRPEPLSQAIAMPCWHIVGHLLQCKRNRCLPVVERAVQVEDDGADYIEAPWVLIASYRGVGMAAVWGHEFRIAQPTRRDTECR